MTYGNGTLTIYLDGVMVHTESVQGSNLSESNRVNIGGWENSDETFSGSINGKIDEVSVWSRSLSDSEIQSHMLTSPISGEEGLVGYWNFNEGEGTTLYDLTGNANHGTINGATWSRCTSFGLYRPIC